MALRPVLVAAPAEYFTTWQLGLPLSLTDLLVIRKVAVKTLCLQPELSLECVEPELQSIGVEPELSSVFLEPEPCSMFSEYQPSSIYIERYLNLLNLFHRCSSPDKKRLSASTC